MTDNILLTFQSFPKKTQQFSLRISYKSALFERSRPETIWLFQIAFQGQSSMTLIAQDAIVFSLELISFCRSVTRFNSLVFSFCFHPTTSHRELATDWEAGAQTPLLLFPTCGRPTVSHQRDGALSFVDYYRLIDSINHSTDDRQRSFRLELVPW